MNWNDPYAQDEAQKYENPIPSRPFILDTIKALIESGTEHINMTLLARHFGIDDAPRLDGLSHRLSAMVRDGQLAYIDDVHLKIAENTTVQGKVSINSKGSGFVVIDDGDDLFLHEKQTATVFHGDTVIAKAVKFKGRAEAKIMQVLARAQNEFVGKLMLDDDGEPFVSLAPPNSHQPLTLTHADIKTAGAAIGDIVRVAMDMPPSAHEFATAKIMGNLDTLNDRELIITTTILNHNLPHEFSAAAIAQANSFDEPCARDFKGRTDLRDMALVTIDGVDSRDFDDAVYAEKRAGGNFRVVVAIADVSHYVREQSALDKDAYERGTSVYFPHHVIPMLPETLSNGLCSLNPNVDRLCMVADMKVSRLGRITDYEFYPAVMHSKARLTYDEVNAYFANSADTALPHALTQNTEVIKSLDTLYQLYHTLDKRRQERGAMAFETAESYIKFGDDGEIVDIVKRTRGDAHKLIEECMLLANTATAKFAIQHDLPVLYRNHDRPDAKKTERLYEYLKTLGVHFVNENPTHDDYQRVIELTRARPDALSVHSMLLRSMMQANYAPDNIGHFGLAYDEYSHFTSPIRRYPDLMLHRAIKAKVTGKKAPAPIYENLAAAGAQTSFTERRAETASRHVESWLKCHHMQKHIGDELAGVVSAVTSFGLFITLNDWFIDGLVHISGLDGYYEFDERTQTLNGGNNSYGLGDSVVVKVMGVNMEQLQIDFAIVSHQGKHTTPARVKPKDERQKKRPRRTRSD